MKIILGTKIGMTQIIGEDGVVTPVTILQAGPCTVVQVKTQEKDGYEAVKVGFGEIKEKNVNIKHTEIKSDIIFFITKAKPSLFYSFGNFNHIGIRNT